MVKPPTSKPHPTGSTPSGEGSVWKSVVTELAPSGAAVILALIVGALLLWVAGYDVRDAYYNLYDGAFGNVYSIADTLLNAIPLLFTGLAVAVAFRGGLFNIGAEGQLYAAALTTAVTAIALGHWPALPLVISALGSGAVAGALWGFIPGFLRAKTGAHEMITTIMFNYMAILLTTYLVKTYFKAPGPLDQTVVIPAAARLPELVVTTRLTWALVIALIFVVSADFVLRRTTLGFDIELIGSNEEAAAYAGVDVARRTMLTMALSGALAGLAGSTLVLGVLHRFITNMSPGYGFTAIAVALVGRAKPWGVVPAAVLFGALQAGGMSMQLFARIPSDVMTVVQGLVILFAAAPGLWTMFSRRRTTGPATETGAHASHGAAASVQDGSGRGEHIHQPNDGQEQRA